MEWISTYIKDWDDYIRTRFGWFNKFKKGSYEYKYEALSAHAKALSEALVGTAEASIGYKRFYHGYKPWYNKQCKEARKKVNKIRRKLQRIEKKHRPSEYLQSQYEILKKEYNILKKEKAKVIRKAKQQYNKDLNYKIQNGKISSKQFWRILNDTSHRQQNHIPPLKRSDGSYTSAPTEQAQLIHDYLKHPPEPKYTTEDRAFHKDIEEKTEQIIHDLQHEEYDQKLDEDQARLNKDIEIYELVVAINRLDSDKATGPDRVHTTFIKEGKNILKHYLKKLFNNLLRYGIYPQIWNEANVLPIGKPGRDPALAKNYRPISLSSVLGKLLEKVLSHRIQVYAVKKRLFGLQCGFQINRNTTDILNTFIQQIYSNLDQQC